MGDPSPWLFQTFRKFHFAPGRGSWYCDEYVCLSVCLLSVYTSLWPLAYLENHTAELNRICMHVACGRGSVLLWRRCYTLCTSGFVDVVGYLLWRLQYLHNSPTWCKHKIILKVSSKGVKTHTNKRYRRRPRLWLISNLDAASERFCLFVRGPTHF